MAHPRTALITCAAQNAALACVRALHAAGWRVAAFDEQGPAKGLASRACAETYVVPVAPAREPEAYAAWVIDRLSRQPTDVLIPITDAAIFALLPRREELERLTAVPWPSTESLRAAADKNETMRLAAELGFHVPAAHQVADPAAIPSDLTYPVVIKPARSLIGGRKYGADYANDRRELEAILKTLPDEAFPVSLQRRIVGPGEGYFAVWRHGEPVVEFAHRRCREMPPSGGVSTLREAIELPADLRDPARRLLTRWRWHGPVMVEYKRDADGRPHLMEVNGRFWGSLQLAQDAGLNLPLAAALVAVGDPVPPMSYRAGVRTRWEWGDLEAVLTRVLKSDRAQHLPPGTPSRARLVWDFLADFTRPNVRGEIFRRDDPGPFRAESRVWLRNRRDWLVNRLHGGPRVTVITHVHSTISYDGELSVAQVAALMRRHGVAVCCFAEHTRGLQDGDVRRLVEECVTHSDRTLQLVPGLEFEVDGGHHILGLGFAELVDETDPGRLCAAIRAGGGLAVLAHPWPGALAGAPPLVAALDAVEVWNTFHHGTYVPNAEALADLRAARQAGAAVVALHGNDFHFADNFRSARLELSLPPGVLGWEHVRTALREGRYRLTNGKLSVGPTGVNLAEIWFLRAMRQAQHAAACLKRRLITPFKPCCWEYLACDPAACCPARIEPNGGQICWRVVGTFTGLDRRGPCCNYLPDCRDCEFYQSRTKQWRGERRRRVLHLIETGNPGGAELMMVNLVGGLDSRRFVSHACLIKEGWLEQKLRDAGVPVAVVPLRRRLNWRFLLTLVRLVRQRRYDVLHSHEFTMNIYAFLIGLLTGVPTVATVHGNIEYVAEKRRRRWLYHVLARLAGPLVAVSEELKRRLVREFNLPAERIAVVPNGVTLPPSPPDAAAARLHRRALGLPEAGPVVGVIGRLHPVKGQDVLLAAWPQVLASHPGACLAVVGQGQSRAALEKTAAALGIASAVVFTGYRDDVAEHLAAFDVVVVPSRYEGLSLLLIEAMAAQRPVVATRVGGNPEAVEDGVSGLLVPAADPSALAAACHRLLDDPALARQLGENARERAERLFSQDTMIRAYERLYETKTKEHA